MSLQKKEQVKTSALSMQVGGDHYKKYVIQPAEFSERNGLGFLEGSVIKRMCRHKDKNGIEDIQKAMHELRLIASIVYEEEIEL